MKDATGQSFDVAVIGGGPAGLMAALTAASHGASVIVLEKNRRPGRKLLITGKGRCNITNAEFDQRRFLANFGEKGKYLFSAFHAFSAEDTVSFFEDIGVSTKVERGNRVFPLSDRAMDVCDALVRKARESGVFFSAGHGVTSFEREGSHIVAAVSGERLTTARAFILATGGCSYPATGSNGDGFRLAASLGHKVVAPKPALVPLLMAEPWIGRLEGLSLKNVRATLRQRGKKKIDRFGEALFTANGMSGPVILDLSREIAQSIENDGAHLDLDLKPALESSELDHRIQRDFSLQPNRLLKNGLGALLPASLIPVIIELSGIDPDKKLNSITRDERKRIGALLKQLTMTVTGTGGFDQAIITAGGISLDEIDMRSMRSRVIENLYFAGEIIDIDGPTGGYNLQVCWSTGFCAGKAAAESFGTP